MKNIAFNFVKSGKDNSLDRVPKGQFGGLNTMDRSEIESLYLKSPGAKRPL